MNTDIKILEFKDLKEKLNSFSNEEINLIEKAYNFAFECHKNEKRKSGEDYIQHPLNVAYILVSLNVDSTTIIAGLLHECPKHCDIKLIEEKFGEDVARLITNLIKINDLTSNDSESSILYARKILVGLSEDVRVIFIKLADRLHNMRTVWALDANFQKIKAKETLNILIPIAHRLGIHSIQSELEDLSLKYLKPDVYQSILEKLEDSREALNEVLKDMKENITELLDEHEIKFKIKARVKSVYSIYKKLETGRKWSEIYDILALRILVEEPTDCYLVIGLIHAKYRQVPKRFKDYIAMPKENMYQSLHTSIFGDKGYIFEIQIRTYEMDDINENGLASHWSYKEHTSAKVKNVMDQKLEMFKNLIESNNDNTSEKELNEVVNNEFLKELIYVYTPKGDVVELPEDSTPIDFAYRIHSNVGEKTVGAIVNDNIVTLDYKLNDGDIINIKTNNNSTPKKEWLSFIKTSQAKNKIKAYFSKEYRNEYIEKGQNLIEKEIRKRKLPFDNIINDKNIEKIKKDLKLNTLEDIYLSVGSLRYTPSYVLDLIDKDKNEVKDMLITKLSNKDYIDTENYNYKGKVIVAGIDDIKVNMAKCCKPVFGEPIAGYITKGSGVTIHNKECYNIKDETARLIDVKWNDNTPSNYITDITIKAYKKENSFLEIVTIAGLKKCYIEASKSKEVDDYIVYNLTVKVESIDNLNNFIDALKSLDFIIEVRRG